MLRCSRCQASIKRRRTTDDGGPILSPLPNPITSQQVNAGPRCEPLLRVLRPGSAKFFCLPSGKAGSYETAAQMANLVREDAVKDTELEDWAKQIVINAGLDSHSEPSEVAGALFRYCQQFTYLNDPGGPFDAIQSARRTIARGHGDCDDLSVLLATLLAMVGFKPRFVLAKYKQESSGFDHIYVDLELARGRLALDPTTRVNGPGWESPRAIERVAYPIFGGAPIGLGDLARAGYRAAWTRNFRGMGCLPQEASTTGSERVVALAAPVFSLPVVLCVIGGCVVAMKLASKL